MTELRCVFMGSPPFATPILEQLIESRHDVVAVVTPPERSAGRGRKPRPSPVAELAREAGIELLQPESMRDETVRARLKELAPDVLCVASYGEILDAEVLAFPQLCPLNVHASLLPRHRGASPIQAAILAGDAVTGVSVQRMVEALDAGDVLLSREVEIGARETAGDLFDRLALLGADALIEALDQLSAGDARFTPQDPDGVTVCRKIRSKRGRLIWTKTAEQLERRVRAMTPWPGAKTTLPDGTPLKVVEAEVFTDAAILAPGEVGPQVSVGRLVVGTATEPLELMRVQPAGKRAMPSADFLRGARLEAGQQLGAPTETRDAIAEETN